MDQTIDLFEVLCSVLAVCNDLLHRPHISRFVVVKDASGVHVPHCFVAVGMVHVLGAELPTLDNVQV